MTTKKLAKLVEKVYLKMDECDCGENVTITVEHEGLVKAVENKDSLHANTLCFNMVGDDIITYSESNHEDNEPTNKMAISAKNFKKLVKIVCSVRKL